MNRTASSLGKDLVGLEHLTREQITTILDTAEPFKEISERAIKKVPTLRGQTIVNLFFESSTRTRVSFEFAEKRLSADTVNVAAAGSSVVKGETLVDTARNLEAMRPHVAFDSGVDEPAFQLGRREFAGRLLEAPVRPDHVQLAQPAAAHHDAVDGQRVEELVCQHAADERLGVDADGELYVLSLQGGFFRIDPA